MIELFQNELIESDLKSSKGNQLKWLSNGYWFKVDRNGYEALSEFVISKLLQKSSLNKNEYVDYELEEILFKDKKYVGCKSKNFLKKNQNLITLERLYQSVYKNSLHDYIDEIYNPEEKCKALVDIVRNLTGIKNFGEYLLTLLTIDSIFLNEDRHFHNIAFIQDNNNFYLSPIFDNGASLLSDTKDDYPLDENELELINNVKSKTLFPDFDKQLIAMENLYKNNLTFSYTDEDIINLLDSIKLYDKRIINRVKRILIRQRQKNIMYFDD